jgi:hypothetical protein
MVSSSRLATLLAAIFLLNACSEPPSGERGLQALKSELKAAGYDLIYPLTTGYRVGYLYEVRETAEGTKFRRTLCEATFVNGEPNQEDLKLADYESDQNTDFGFFVGLSEKLLKDRATAQATLKASNVKMASVSFDNMKSYELPPKLRPDGTKRSVDQTCEINIKSAVDADGRFLRPTYLVIGAARSDALNYQFDTAGSFGADLEVQLKGIFKVVPKVKSDASGKKTIVVTPDRGKQFAIGGQAIALSHAKILDEVTDDFSVAFEVSSEPALLPAETLALPEN